MKMNFKFWMLLVPMALSLASCMDDNIDNPVNPVEPSAVDEGKWNVTESHMDKTYRPGDNFFMYCNGGYWNSTQVDDATPIKALLIDQAQSWVNNCEAALTIPSKAKLLADIEKSDEATIAAQKAKLQSALDRVNALTTREEAWQLMAEMMMEGYRTPFNLNIFSRSGKIAAVLFPIEDNKDYNSPLLPEQTLAWQLANNPDVLACVRPIKSGTTRGFDSEKWPMLVTMFRTLGISLEDAYTMDVVPTLVERGLGEMAVFFVQQLQDRTVDEWKTELIATLSDDAVFFDDAALEAANANAAKPLTRKDMLDNFIKKYLQYEISRAFTDAYITTDMKQRTREYCEQLRQTFRERIQQNVWMSDGSKQNAIEKLNAMVFNIGAPDTWFDEGFADLSQEQTLYDDIRALRRAMFGIQRKLIGMTTAEICFHYTILQSCLTTVNAFYVPNTNCMNIYPAWMVAPYYDLLLNDAHNYATMTVFGHEITHGFDTSGAKYDKMGDLVDIWANEADRQEFQNRAQQLIDYFSQFEVMPVPGLHNDGAYTVGENVADLGGFLLAYDTYVRHLENLGFKGEQLQLQKQHFHEAYAYLWSGKWTADYALKRTGDEARPKEKDTHSMFSERVNGIVTNTDDWYDLFDVKPTDKLYLAPEKRIRIW